MGLSPIHQYWVRSKCHLTLLIPSPLYLSLPCRPSCRVIKANCLSKLATFMLNPKIGHAKSCLYYCYLICHKCHYLSRSSTREHPTSIRHRGRLSTIPSLPHYYFQLSSQFSNCTQNDVTSQRLSWTVRLKNYNFYYYSFNTQSLKSIIIQPQKPCAVL